MGIRSGKELRVRIMDSYSGKRRDDPEDFEFDDELLDDEFLDPEDIPLPGMNDDDLDKLLKKREKKNRQNRRRRERHDKYHSGREEDF